MSKRSRESRDPPPDAPTGAIKTGGYIGIDSIGGVWINTLYDGWVYIGSAAGLLPNPSEDDADSS